MSDKDVGAGYEPTRRSWRWRRWFRFYVREAMRWGIIDRDGRMLAIEAERFASQASRNHR